MRNPYKPATHSRETTPTMPLKPIGRIRRALRAFFLWLAGLSQGHPAWPTPLEQFFALEDKPGRIYVWTLRSTVSDKEASAMAADFAEEFKRKFNRETKALHIMTPDVDVLRRLTKADAEKHILPWLKAEE